MSTRVVFPRHRGVKGTHPIFFSTKGRGRSGEHNCFKPSLGEGSKQELRELHKDNMRERRVRYMQNKRGPGTGKTDRGVARFSKWFDKAWKQQDVSWRGKSIWPDGKVAIPGRMG